jgi:hypothetical protein
MNISGYEVVKIGRNYDDYIKKHKELAKQIYED